MSSHFDVYNEAGQDDPVGERVQGKTLMPPFDRKQDSSIKLMNYTIFSWLFTNWRTLQINCFYGRDLVASWKIDELWLKYFGIIAILFH